MIADEPTGEQTDLREYLRILRRRSFVVAGTLVVVVGLVLAYSFISRPVYSAKANVLIPQVTAAAQLNTSTPAQPAADSLQRTLADEQQLAQGDQVRTAARTALGFPANASITTSTTSDVLTFSATNGNKAQAAAVANAFANSYIATSDATLTAQYTQDIAALKASLAQLQTPGFGSASNQSSVISLTETLQQLQAASNLVSQTGPTIIKAATPPTSPVSPKPIRNGLVALLLGLVLGVALAFLFERLDDGINSREDAERSTGGLPVVGLIPMVDAWRRKHEAHLALVEDSTSQVSEAYRSLRTSLQFFSIDEAKEVVGITSSIPDEGKTTTVANLAVSLARAGQRVVVVSCDLRRPRLHSFFQENNEVGLTSVLLGDSNLSAALQAVPEEPHLRVLPSGPIPPNPTELLTLDRVREVIETLTKISDIVLIDCPPVLPVSDTLLLSRLVDGMLILASARTTSKRSLARTTQLLGQVHAPMLGTVLNRVPQRGSKGYGYGYEYDYGSYSAGPRSDGPKADRGSSGGGRREARRLRKVKGDAVISGETMSRAVDKTSEGLGDDGFPRDLDNTLLEPTSDEGSAVREYEGRSLRAEGDHRSQFGVAKMSPQSLQNSADPENTGDTNGSQNY